MSRAGRLVAAVALLAAVSVPERARAHEVLHEVQRGKAIAVRARFSDGEPFAYASFEVYSPADPGIPWQKGRTDRRGWLAFVPEVAGRWRVKVFDDTGHGFDVNVDAEEGAAPSSSGGLSGVAFVLRPLLGLLVIGAVFAALILRSRRRGGGR